MDYDKEENGFISVPAPEFGAIFMSNIATKRDCFKHKVFGLPSSMANFVKEVKKGMILFLFEYERRQLFGVYRAISDGEMNIAPNAFSSSGKQFSAQVRFVPIWYCSPLSENEFRDAIRENYFSARKFHFGLSEEQVHRLLRLFSSRKLKNKLPPRKLTTGASNGVDEDHIAVNNSSYATSVAFDVKRSDVDLEPSLSRGYPRSFRGVKRVNDDMFLIEHRVKDGDKIDSAEHLYYNDKRRRLGNDGRLLRDNAAEDKLHIHSLTEHEANLVVRDQIVNENNMDGNFGLGRSNQQRKPSDGDRTRIGTHYAGFLRNNSVDKAHSMDDSHEPVLSRKNRSDPFCNIGTVSDDWQSSLDRVGKKSHLDSDIYSTIVSERFVNSPYNQKGMPKDGRLFTREISRNESKFHTGLGRGFDHQAATDDDECFLSRRKGANKKCVDSFLIPAASDGNSTYAGDVGRQVAEVRCYPMNDFDRLVPGTEDFQRPLTVAGRTGYSPMNKRTSGCSTMFLAETEFPQLTEAQNLGPSCSKFHDATIPRVMPRKHELPSSCYEHTETYEVEQGSNFVQKQPSSDVYRKNNYASSKGISSPYSYPEFTKRGLESASEDGHTVLLRSQDGFNTPPVNVGISEAMEPNRSCSFSYSTAFIPRESIGQQFRDDINEGENWRFSSQAALSSTAHLYSGNYQCADEELGDGHVIWQGSDIIHAVRRSRSPNSSWLLRQGNVLTNLDHTNNPGADIINNEYEDNILTDVVHSDSRNSRRSVFNRLSLAPEVCKLREQVADHSMSYDEYYMDTSVDEIMDLLYEDQNIVPKKPLNRKPYIRKVGYGETNRSGKHAAVVKNDAEQPGDSMMRVLRESANEVLEETLNHVLAETRVVDFKRRRQTNRASEQTNAKFNEVKTNASEHTVLQNAQENSCKTAVAKDSADKPSKHRKLVRPVFDENNSRSDLNHQLPCHTVDKVNTGNSDSSEFQSAL
ncbi:PREDICTED: uncharacterized protein LOC109209666 [Nicotiana attenuata]|uniref:B2 protein n=1 Tax=Nicotiana attenuata TaxID=49451 RepID=A0A1J6ING9_NICAT|nr:PREDICTED: uncharacterized protein LOC109209666 [Nicotiana attenuata]XP_019228533.1 PREDICTED: uncharacterized protein LOC109209666 [Nicotiana attenuata]XP_019228539.1 PREDICTED: uncharacterized protein LOC109209666 [Nicotiana attenuata]OIT06242.1 b2 protein [Nicotiana attenuata]